MEVFFSRILNMSMTASVVIVLVMLARLALKRMPKIYSYVLWSVVLFRLLCPVSFSGPMSVLEMARPKVMHSENLSVVYYEVVEQAMEDTRGQETSQQAPISEEAAPPPDSRQELSLMEISAWLWLTGLCLMVLASLVNYLQLHRRLQTAVHWRGEIYLADHIGMPFVLGILSPRIYLPSGMPKEERRYIIAHERHHMKRLDPLWKLLGYFALCVHWFNPLVWAAFALAGKDMEMSCDEAVIRRLGPEIRADYAASLLRLSTGRRTLSGMPLAFGEGDTKGRLKNMANWKRPRVWVSVLCIVLCLIIALACALNPEEEQSLEELTHWEGPSSSGFGDLNLYLPEGCAMESTDSLKLNDWELMRYMDKREGLYPYNVIFKEGETTVGGVNGYYLPESFTPADFEWIRDLGLWEFEDETLGHMISSGTEWAWEIEFFSDLPEDAPDKVLRKHYIFLSEDMTMAYDLWFDLLTVNEGIYQQILNSCVVGGGRHKPVAATREFLDFATYLPEGYVLLMDQPNVRYIAHDNTIVGGITAYEKPDLELKFGGRYPMEEWNSDEWLAAMGFEEEKGLAYIGGGSIYGDFERCYSSDVPEGQPITDDRYHTFFIREEYVYDVWFDMMQIERTVADSILSGITGKRGAVVPQVSETKETQSAPSLESEKTALERCRSVLEQVQSCSRALRCERSSAHDEGVMEYWLHEEDWMTIQTHPGDNILAFMYKDGTYYDNSEMMGEKIGARDESGNIIWKESEPRETFHIPWLSRYQWNEEAVVYLGTEEKENEIHIQLRIEEPFPGFEWGNPEYDVTMVFDKTHLFLRAELSVNEGHSSQSEFTETESIVSLFSETVATQMDEKSRNILS